MRQDVVGTGWLGAPGGCQGGEGRLVAGNLPCADLKAGGCAHPLQRPSPAVHGSFHVGIEVASQDDWHAWAGKHCDGEAVQPVREAVLL